MKNQTSKAIAGNRIKNAFRLSLASTALACVGYSSAASWTPVTPAPSSIGTMLMLPDGTVMAQGNPFDTWYRLKPNAQGNYASGTWTARAPMSMQRLFFASHVLPNGKVWVLGGEYSGPSLSQNLTNTGEIYDPVANSWAPMAPHPDDQFGDDPSMLLNNGKILAGSIFLPVTYTYDIATNTWSGAIPKVNNDRSDEETWVKLADGRVLTYDLFSSVDVTGQYAEVYDEATNKWTSISPSDRTAKGTIPQLSSVEMGYELGPIVKVPGPGIDGRIFVIGATGHTALYAPATNTWSPGPDVIGTLNGTRTLFGAADAPAAMLPSGHVLFAADASPSAGLFNGPTKLFDYNPTTNTIAPASPPPTGANLNGPAYVTRMLVLPTGQVLLTDGGNQLWIYTPDGQPAPNWRPVFANVTYDGHGVFTLQGVRMNGPSAGSSYGDDAESDENYPIVRMQDAAGHVVYARTSNWSSTGVGTSVHTEKVSFTMPATTPAGQYTVLVSGAGVSSNPRCINMTAAQISGSAPAANAALTCGPK